jgi:hypothetical protein
MFTPSENKTKAIIEESNNRANKIKCYWDWPKLEDAMPN